MTQNRILPHYKGIAVEKQGLGPGSDPVLYTECKTQQQPCTECDKVKTKRPKQLQLVRGKDDYKVVKSLLKKKQRKNGWTLTWDEADERGKQEISRVNSVYDVIYT